MSTGNELGFTKAGTPRKRRASIRHMVSASNSESVKLKQTFLSLVTQIGIVQANEYIASLRTRYES